MKPEPAHENWPGQAELQREPRAELSSEATKASDSPGSPGEQALDGLRTFLASLQNPRNQLRGAVALQIGQLNELSLLITQSRNLAEAAGREWAGWIERSQITQEDLIRGLQDLAEAKRQQEVSLLTFRQGLAAAKDEDTARMEAGLRNLASAALDLRNATETTCGTGTRFGHQVAEALITLERSLPEVADRAGMRLEAPITRLQGALRPLTWVVGVLGILLAVDMVLRLLR